MFPVVLIESVLALLGLGLVAAGVPTGSDMILSLGCSMVAGAGLVHLWVCFARRHDYWSFCDIHAAALLISYFGGAAVTLWLSKGGVIAFWSAPDLGDMFIAGVYILLFCAMLRLLGRIESRFWLPVWRAETKSDHWPSWTVLFLAGLGAAQFYMLLTGLVTLSGTGTFDGFKLPYLPSLVVALSWPLPGICGWILGRAELRRHRPLMLTALALIPLQLLFNINYGRRILLFQSMIFFASFLWARGRGFTLRQMVLLGAPGLPVMYLLWMLFLALRVDSYGDFTDQGQRRDLFDRLGTTSELMSERWSVLQESQVVDVVNRVFVIGFMTDLIRGSRPGAPLTGKKFAYDVVTGIPRFLLPSKPEILAELDAGEDAVSVRFGIPVTDRADTVVVSSYADFLWLGLALYPPLVMLLGIFLAWISAIVELGIFRVFTVSYTLLTALSAEQALFTGSLNMIRVLVVMLPIFVLLEALKGKSNGALVLPRQKPFR